MNNKVKQMGAAALCGLLLLQAGGCRGGDEPPYQTVRPERGPVESTVEDTGMVAYTDNYAIAPVVNGKILTCAIEEGDVVEKGQVLYTIDAGDLEDQITQAVLALENANAALKQSRAAQADLTVRTSAAGVVTQVYCHVGDYVTMGTPVADVVDSANLTLTVPFDKEDAASIGPGSAAVITFQMYQDRLPGTVKRVYDAPTVMPGGRAGVYVEIAFQNPGALDRGTVAMAAVGSALCMDTGTVDFATAQSIYATQTGKVATLPIEAGTAVAVGQAVMTIENSSVTNGVENAALAQKTAAVNLEQLKAKREDYTITAPEGGTIIQRTAKEGDYAAAAAPLATLAQLESLCVNADIDELYIDRIWPGQSAAVTLTAGGGEPVVYQAQVRRVDDTGVTSGGVTDYKVELALADTEGLKAGMNVDVAIVTEHKEDCLRLPAGAVSQGSVQVLENGKPVEKAVKSGLSGNGYTEILEGLTESDTVVLP